MGELGQVRDVFGNLRRSLDRLDFLVLSAGINTNQFGLDADGIDRHFGVNYLGQFYVCNQLWPVLVKTASNQYNPPPRVVFEASEMHRTAPNNVHFASLDEINDKNLGPTELYGRTKLAMILFAKYGLAEKVIKPNGQRIYAVSVHPGAVSCPCAPSGVFFANTNSDASQVNTAMQQQWKDAYPGLTGKLLTWAMLAVGRDPEQGAFSALWALTDPKIENEEMNGWYFSDPDQPGKESAQASDPVLGKALWDISERLIKEKVGEDALVDWSESA